MTFEEAEFFFTGEVKAKFKNDNTEINLRKIFESKKEKRPT